MSKKFLLKTPQARMTVEPRLDADKKPVINEHGQTVVDVKEVISPLFGYGLALQTVTSGPKLFEVWALRKRIQEVHFQDKPAASARYLIVTAEELELLVTAFKTIDWTFGQKSLSWTEWQELFDSVQNVPEFDEKNPPVEYLDWKKVWDAAEAAKEAVRVEAERKVQLERAAAEAKRTDAIAKITSARLADALALKVSEGKLGSAAGVDDLPKDLVDTIKAESIVDYDANPAAFAEKVVEPAPVGPTLVEAEFTEVPAPTPTTEADGTETAAQ